MRREPLFLGRSRGPFGAPFFFSTTAASLKGGVCGSLAAPTRSIRRGKYAPCRPSASANYVSKCPRMTHVLFRRCLHCGK